MDDLIVTTRVYMGDRKIDVAGWEYKDIMALHDKFMAKGKFCVERMYSTCEANLLKNYRKTAADFLIAAQKLKVIAERKRAGKM